MVITQTQPPVLETVEVEVVEPIEVGSLKWADFFRFRFFLFLKVWCEKH